MNRKEFLKSLAILSITGSAMKLNALNSLASSFDNTVKMPVIFAGHGNPMNAITENDFSQGFRKAVHGLPRPNAIICISAHWETKGTFVTAMDQPKTIHDFGGFPKALSEVQYPSPGSPETANEIKQSISATQVNLDYDWGLDHGCWSVLKHMYPSANVPVIQLSLDYTKPPRWHYELAMELSALRNKGVLIIGSGNMVHNLGKIQWNSEKPLDWAVEANENFKELILNSDHSSLFNYKQLGREVQLAVPTPEHYLPLLYSLGLKDKMEEIKFFNDKIDLGSVSMTSLRIG